MRRSSLAFLLTSFTLAAGCATPVPAQVETVSAPEDAAAPAFETLAWSGHVLTSEGEILTHFRPTEDALWAVEQEGVLVEVPEGATAMEVALSWEGPGRFMIMLHSHKEHGTNVYVEHITELDDENPKCLRVPAADVVPGAWQVMVHSEEAQMTDFTLTVLATGGTPALVEDDRHGHWPQDGQFEIDEHEVEPCAMWKVSSA